MSAEQQIWGRLQMLVAQGAVTRVTPDKVQVKVLDEEVLDNIKRIQPYGFSHCPPGGEAYLVFPSGDRSFGIALIVGDKRYTMDLAGGEVAIHDDEGNHVHIQRGGVIEVKAATKVIADCPLFETTGDVKVGGNLVVVGNASIASGFTVNGKDVGDGHTHTTGTLGQPTSGVI